MSKLAISQDTYVHLMKDTLALQHFAALRWVARSLSLRILSFPTSALIWPSIGHSEVHSVTGLRSHLGRQFDVHPYSGCFSTFGGLLHLNFSLTSLVTFLVTHEFSVDKTYQKSRTNVSLRQATPFSAVQRSSHFAPAGTCTQVP